MQRLMKTLVLLKSNPVVHTLFLIMNIVAILREEQEFFFIFLFFIWQPSQISFNQKLASEMRGFMSHTLFIYML